MRTILPLTFAALPCLLAAQTTVGDIAATGYSSTRFGIFGGAGPVVAYVTPGFQGGASQTILWDDQQPASFLIGGPSFLGRATILGPGTVQYTVLTTNVGIVMQMAWDAQHRLVFADAATAAVHRFDPATGAVTALTNGPQPWGFDLSALARDPLTGDVFVGGSAGVHRLAAGTTTATPIVTGLGSFVADLALDPSSGDLIAGLTWSHRVVRITRSGTVTDLVPPQTITSPNALAYDHDNELLVGSGNGEVFRLPRSGGAPISLFVNNSPFGTTSGLAVVGAGGYGLPFGNACQATFGPATLRTDGPFRTGTTMTTTSTGHAPSSLGVLVLGTSRTNWGTVPLPLPLDPLLGTAGCSLLVSGDITLAGLADAGSPAVLSFALPLPAGLAGAAWFAQHVALEAVAGGMSWSNGLAVTIR